MSHCTNAAREERKRRTEPLFANNSNNVLYVAYVKWALLTKAAIILCSEQGLLVDFIRCWALHSNVSKEPMFLYPGE